MLTAAFASDKDLKNRSEQIATERKETRQQRPEPKAAPASAEEPKLTTVQKPRILGKINLDAKGNPVAPKPAAVEVKKPETPAPAPAKPVEPKPEAPKPTPVAEKKPETPKPAAMVEKPAPAAEKKQAAPEARTSEAAKKQEATPKAATPVVEKKAAEASGRKHLARA